MEAEKTETSSRTLTAQELPLLIRRIPILARMSDADIACLGPIDMIDAPAGVVLFRQGESVPGFGMVLEGEVRASRREVNGTDTPIAVYREGDTFGEAPLLMGAQRIGASCETLVPTRLLRVEAEGFWRMMATCPNVRQSVLANALERIHTFQAITLHQEKLISLGTLAAGLMHELNNPGAAARRSAAQLRENLMRLQDISIKFCDTPLTHEQMHCLLDMQAEVLGQQKAKPGTSSLEESDAEEELANWLESLGVANSWKLAPTLVAAGWRRNDITCAKEAFPAEALQHALNWLEALISAMQQLGTIEESLSRVTELVVAVKKYAYEDKSGEHVIDIHESIRSTLIILGHKFRHKVLTIEKDFAAELPRLTTRGTGLSQVWTNLLDNATDAAPDGSKVTIRTWVEGGAENGHICVGVGDEGPGIAPELREKIFEPFFTTKPAGVGTGLGLEIARRIVTTQFKGSIGFTSEPGRTEFVVKLPVEQAKK
jgi:signal transduction histidine kinase